MSARRRVIVVVVYWIALISFAVWLFTTPPIPWPALFLIPGVVAGMLGGALLFLTFEE